MDKQMDIWEVATSYLGMFIACLTIGLVCLLGYLTNGNNIIIQIVIQFFVPLIFYVVTCFAILTLHNNKIKKNLHDRELEK